MAQLALLSLPAYGHITPTLPIVAELVRRGDHVRCYNSEEFRQPIERAGAEFRAYPEPMPTSAAIGRLLDSGNLARVVVLILRQTETLLPFVVHELRREPPDALLFDSSCLWGAMAARQLGLMAVASIASFIPSGGRPLTWRERVLLMGQGLRVLPGFLAARRRLLRGYGPDVFRLDNLLPALGDLNLLYTCRELQPETPLVDESFRLVGTSIDPSQEQGELPFSGEPRQPLIYVAAGTLMAGSSFFTKCKQALSEHAGQVIVAAGRIDLEQLGAMPAHFTVRQRVPQLGVLQHAAVFVTHGGMNSVHEGLYFGVPQVVVPHNAEWAFIGRRVQECGAGLMIGGEPPYGRATAHELRAAVERVLNEEHFRAAARRLSRSLRQAGGYSHAADEIQRFVGAAVRA